MEFKHSFAICAYKESPYLEECIISLLKQSVASEIYLATSTPCQYISDLCDKYNIPMFVNEGESGITQDWNFAYSKCQTEYITIAHQDDVYFADYTKNLIEMMDAEQNPIIFFTDYFELRNGEYIKENRNLKIKRLLLNSLRKKSNRNKISSRRRALSLGDPICCPSVGFARKNCPEVVFQNHFRTDEDWEAWEMLSKRKGAFVYCDKPLMAHRIHAESETTAMIQESGRSVEDLEMFQKFWPNWIAKLLTKVYSSSEKSNDV